MKQSELKIGQRIKRKNYEHGSLKVGDVRKVIAIDPDQGCKLEDDTTYWHDPMNLELIEDTNQTQTTMEYVQILRPGDVGRHITVVLDGRILDDAKLQLHNGKWYICNNIHDGGHSYVERMGYKYAWSIGNEKEDMTRHKITFVNGQATVTATEAIDVKEKELTPGEIYLYKDRYIFLADQQPGKPAHAKYYVDTMDKHYGMDSNIGGGTYKTVTRAQRAHLYACVEAKKYVAPPVVNKFIPGDKVLINDIKGTYYEAFGDETVHGSQPGENQPGVVIKERDHVCLVEFTKENIHGDLKTMRLGFHEDVLTHSEPMSIPLVISDLRDTKIWIGEDIKLRRKVLERLKELGCSNVNPAEFVDSVSFYIDKNKHVRHSTSDNQAKTKDGGHFNESTNKELFCIDLGIMPEGLPPDMDPEMLIQMIVNG